MPKIDSSALYGTVLGTPDHGNSSVAPRILCTRNAWQYLEPLMQLDDTLGSSYEVIRDDLVPPEGPVILLLAANDLRGSDRARLLAVTQRTHPMRAIIIGGTDDRVAVLEAINDWHAFRLIPSGAPPDAIFSSIRRAAEMLQLETSVERYARHLIDICRRLSATAQELHVTQSRLLQAERLAAVGTTIGTLTTHMHEQSLRLEVFRQAALEVAAAEGTPAEASTRIAGLLAHLAEAQGSFDALLTDMLALAGLGTPELRRKRLALEVLVSRTVRLFQYDPLGQERQIYVDCHTGILVLADADRLRHALLNLLRNAAQATTPTDHIRVRLRRVGDDALIEVEDTGVGMTAETLERLFTPFFTTKGVSGMGLGLRLARAAIEDHGGTLECASVAGQGSAFYIRLPIAT